MSQEETADDVPLIDRQSAMAMDRAHFLFVRFSSSRSSGDTNQMCYPIGGLFLFVPFPSIFTHNTALNLFPNQSPDWIERALSPGVPLISFLPPVTTLNVTHWSCILFLLDLNPRASADQLELFLTARRLFSDWLAGSRRRSIGLLLLWWLCLSFSLSRWLSWLLTNNKTQCAMIVFVRVNKNNIVLPLPR